MCRGNVYTSAIIRHRDLRPENCLMDVRNFLDSHRANLQQHSSQSVVINIAHGLYAEAEGREADVQTEKMIVANGRLVRR